MSEKCNKYESLFVFSTEEKLEEHISICPDCREQHEKMKKTAGIAQEVASYYKDYGKQKSNFSAIKSVAGLIIIVLAYFLINQTVFDKDINNYNLSYNQNESVISEMGLPTDDYGFLMVY